ncbi:hypothetical protein RAC89_26890 [Paenibacillus sp. GD4]|uniref:hypothetical protein n=1 Tax=Paenibacillus sp. GD4 TaxID=3068890 RepID=UPI002796D25B|nr:hypothetical protein [Paenibacillus sp. GD4]MDQ1914034.1 hypothetical protein [Paenibacillus sp. GD4]
MKQIDDELKNGLANGPLTRNGFSDTLKKRIIERANEQESKSRKWFPWFSMVSVSLLIVAAFLSIEMQSKWGKGPVDTGEEQRSFKDSSASPSFGSYDQNEVEIQSAVLIGLRQDHPSAAGTPEYSSYRTVLLADREGELQTLAQGEGILMPYKTDFLKIAPQKQVEGNEESWRLNASLASLSKKPEAFETMPAKPLKTTEKLLFAGNRYLSVAQSMRHVEGGKEVQYDYVWVKEVQDLMQAKSKQNPVPAQDSHVSLNKLYGASVQAKLMALNATSQQTSNNGAMKGAQIEPGESWAIVRERGQWVPQLALYSMNEQNHAYHYRLHDISMDLPDSVVSYDRLTVDWSEVRQVRPDAKDAFTSPKRELVGIVSDKELTVYSYDKKISSRPLITLPLAAGESVVMIQWAIDAPYIEIWKNKAVTLLGE